ncbi:MAG: class I SAM-dependent methyltransferase [Alphaproteobacteria bacterium]|nr:class I SAM-dependent methyltransferase [Alphaproteobacteria bacterium]
MTLTSADRMCWDPIGEVVAYLVSLTAGAKTILDVGPGAQVSLFPRATHAVDFTPHSFPGVESAVADFRRDRLPYGDKSFDFVYCRHVVEDLDDPLHLCREMMRVGRRGYIETPSPLAEVCRGIDGGNPPWRGYYHHRHFVYSVPGSNRLSILAKSPRMEHDPMDDETIVRLLRSNPFLWNTYFLWDEAFEIEFVSDELLRAFWRMSQGKPFGPSYQDRLNDAVNAGIASAIEAAGKFEAARAR